ncbi:MAG: GNAT family protein [Candidatus Woesearchaeota archaeon]
MKKQINLRDVELRDAEIIANWFNDQNNVQFMSTVVRCLHHTKESVENDIKNIDLNFERLFIVELENESIGYAGIDDIDFDDKKGEVFVIIGDKDQQGKGYGQQVMKLLLKVAFDELKLNSLFATVTVENKASSIMLQKSGFKEIGIRREYNYINGKFVDEIFYDLIRRDYMEGD